VKNVVADVGKHWRTQDMSNFRLRYEY